MKNSRATMKSTKRLIRSTKPKELSATIMKHVVLVWNLKTTILMSVPTTDKVNRPKGLRILTETMRKKTE